MCIILVIKFLECRILICGVYWMYIFFNMFFKLKYLFFKFYILKMCGNNFNLKRKYSLEIVGIMCRYFNKYTEN